MSCWKSSGTEARSTCEAFRNAMEDERQELSEIAAKAEIYPFLDAVDLGGKPAMAKKDNSYLLTQLKLQRGLAGCRRSAHPLKNFSTATRKRCTTQLKPSRSTAMNSATCRREYNRSLTCWRFNAYAGGLIPKANNAQTALGKLQQRLQLAREAAKLT